MLRGVDFDVARGGIFALLGSNGAGKTTVAKILATVLKVDAGTGTVDAGRGTADGGDGDGRRRGRGRSTAGTGTVDGGDVATRPARVRESTRLTGQFSAVDEVLAGRENLALTARLSHLKHSSVVAEVLLGRFALTDAAARRVAAYSGGMRRRLVIAMSLIGNPPILFLDEPRMRFGGI